MPFYPCIDCAVIWLVPTGVELTCPRCDQPLTLTRRDEGDSVSWVQIAGEALHGPAPRVRPRWSIE